MSKIFTVLFIISNLGFTQTINIANWYENKEAAVVLTFDDWLPSHPNIVVNMLAKKEIPATFFVTIQNTKNHPESFNLMRKAYENGCEIANHTVTHPDLTNVDFEKAKEEILTARKILMDSIPGNPCLSFSFPMGSKNNELIEFLKNHHINSRGINMPNENNLSYNFIKQSSDYYKLETLRVWRISTPKKVSNWLNYAQKGGGLITFMIHSVVNESNPPGWDPIPENFLSEVLDTVKAHNTKLWITTLGKATQYHQQKNNSKIDIEKSTPKKLIFSVNSTLDKKLFFHALTILIEKDKEIESIKIGKQNIEFSLIQNQYQFNIGINSKNIEINYKN